MSRAKGSGNGGRRGGRGHGHDSATEEMRTLATFLRKLAERAERDSALAARLREALRASGLLDGADHSRCAEGPPTVTRASRAGDTRRHTHRSDALTAAAGDPPPDPFVLLRERGEDGLRAALDGLELAALRTIVRTHRLDPARISARWTARERVIALIVTQVRGRADMGKAFARV